MVFARPAQFKQAIILANGAGIDMKGEFISYFHEALARAGYLACKFNFLYQEKGRKAPDRAPVLEETYLAVHDYLVNHEYIAPGDIFIGGKSMGGRIATQIANRAEVGKIVLLGYPLHPAGKPDQLRDEHLYDIQTPMLFLSGDRDPLCGLDKLKPIIAKIKPARLHVVEGGDHSFKVLKKSDLDQDTVMAETVERIRLFLDTGK